MFKVAALLAQALLVMAALAASQAGWTQTYPDRPVKLIVGFAPGGTNDILARLVAPRLQEHLKQPFVVENKPGAASMVAAEFSANAPPDGYTLFVASSGALTINPAIYSKINYDPVNDFTPVALLGSFPLVLTVNSASSIKDLKGLIEAGKRAPNGSIDHGVGSSTFQLAAEVFGRDTGVKFNHIPYKGTGPTVTALLSGEIQMAIVDIAAIVPLVNSGRLRALAVTTAARSAVLPDVPSVAEGGVKGYDVFIWTGLVVPKRTPAEVSVRLRTALKEILAEKDVAVRLRALGMEPGHTDSAAFARQISADLARWSAVAKAANIKAD